MIKFQATSFFFLMLLMNIFLYWPHTSLGYILDDYYVVSQNSAVKRPSLHGLLTSGFFDAANRNVDSQLHYYRPVVLTSLALDYQLWGNRPFMFRWMSLAIHFASSLLVALFLYQLFRNFRLAATGSLVFSVLPVHEWSVRYITGRGDLLSAFFGLIFLILLVEFLRTKNKSLLWVSLVCFYASVLSKESALLNGLLTGVVALVVTRNIRQSLRCWAFFLLAAGSYWVLRQMFAPLSAVSVFEWEGLFKGLGLSFEYVQRFLMPWSTRQWIPGEPWLGLILNGTIVIWICACIIRLRDRQTAWLGIVWILIGSLAFGVTHRIIDRLGPVLSEHFLYFEAIGFVLLLSLAIDQISHQRMRRILLVGFLGYFMIIGGMNARYWISEEMVLNHVQDLQGHQKKGVAYEQLQMRYVADPSAVMLLIEQSTSSDTQSIWYRRLGEIYRRQKQYPQAMNALAYAVDLNPRNIEAINALAVCHLEIGQMMQGVKLLEGSLLISPRQSDALRLLGVLNYRQGQFVQAISFLQQAWTHDPDQKEAALHLMMAYFFMNDQAAYVKTVDRVSDQFKDIKTILGFAAEEFFIHGYYSETIKTFERLSSVFKLDDKQVSMLAQARQRSSHLPK